MNDIARKIVDFAIADNPTDIKANFQTAIAPKIVDLLDAKKMELGQSLFDDPLKEETMYEDLGRTLASAKNNAATLKKPVHVFAHKNEKGTHYTVTARDMAASSSKSHEIRKTHTIHPDGAVTVH